MNHSHAEQFAGSHFKLQFLLSYLNILSSNHIPLKPSQPLHAGYDDVNNCQNNVANVGEEMIEVGYRHQRVRAGKVEVAEILITSIFHHLTITISNQYYFTRRKK